MRSSTPSIDYKMPAALSAPTSQKPTTATRGADSDSDEEYTFDGENVTVSKNPTYTASIQRQATVVKGAMPTDFTKKQADEPSGTGAVLAANGPLQVKVTQYIPSKNPNRIRERSQRVLDDLRAEETERTGQAPRLVYDDETGFLLPRDQIVQYADAAASPAQREGRSSGRHYQRTLDIMKELKEERLIRHFEGM